MKLDAGYRIDLFVEDEIIVEIKAVERLLPVHLAQLLSYLKLSKKNLGFLINFNVPRLRDGIKRVVNNLWNCIEFFLTAKDAKDAKDLKSS